jgi:hypothetical protein
MLRVSVNGQPPQEANSVVLYDQDVPIAAAVDQKSTIFFCDAARDLPELSNLLRILGVQFNQNTISVDTKTKEALQCMRSKLGI